MELLTGRRKGLNQNGSTLPELPPEDALPLTRTPSCAADLIPLPHDRNLRHRLVKLLQVVGREFDCRCPVIFVKTLQLA